MVFSICKPTTQRACLLSNKSNVHPLILYGWKKVHKFYFSFSIEHKGKTYSRKLAVPVNGETWD